MLFLSSLLMIMMTEKVRCLTFSSIQFARAVYDYGLPAGQQTLRINEQARQALQKIEGPVCVACVVGTQGIGKVNPLQQSLIIRAYSTCTWMTLSLIKIVCFRKEKLSKLSLIFNFLESLLDSYNTSWLELPWSHQASTYWFLLPDTI